MAFRENAAHFGVILDRRKQRNNEAPRLIQRPLIGVICCRRLIRDDWIQSVAERYLDAVIRFADVDAVLIPSLPEIQDVRAILGRLDGVLLTGSPSNVEPVRYGGTAPGEGPFDPERDATAMRLIESCVAQNKPLLGICRGFQEVNVGLGGSLQTDLGAPDRDVPHHVPGEVDFETMFEFRHPVDLSDGGILHQATGQSRIEVNSVHYQGVERLGPDLFVEARATDGTVEAVRLDSPGSKLLAVQWHPEWRTEANPVSRSIYALFGTMARGASLAEAARTAHTGT